MLKERIKEIVDYATTESPYRQATKGWITDDLFIQWGSNSVEASKSGVELAEVAVFWKPINSIASRLLLVLFTSLIFVFTTVSLAHGKLKIVSNSLAENSPLQPIETSINSLENQSNQLEFREPQTNREQIDVFVVDEKEEMASPISQQPMPERSKSLITAQDMFQPKRL